MLYKYYLQVYGCQMNSYEAGLVRSILKQAGYQESGSEFDANILLMMTCSVREHAEKRALGRLKNWIGFKKNGFVRIVGILGCMAQSLKENLIDIHHADLVIGPDQYQRLPDLILAVLNGNSPQIAVDFSNESYENICPDIKSGITSFLTIVRGCNNSCSYCIVPYVKGRERSKPVRAVLSEACQLIERGVKEITLLGQNVLAYRYQNIDFVFLLEKICAFGELLRVRFLTTHPRDLNEQVIKNIAQLPKVCPQLHLPVQSAANRILKLMNRGYTIEEYLTKVEMIRHYLPEVSLTTDVITGFPTETAEEFDATLRLLETVRFDYAYIFKFSPRKGTPGAEITPSIPKEVVQNRLNRLIETQNRITRESNLRMLNKHYEVLIENSSRRRLGSLGRTPQGKVVILDEILPPGYLVNVKISQIQGWTPKGKIVSIRQTAEVNSHAKTISNFVREGN